MTSESPRQVTSGYWGSKDSQSLDTTPTTPWLPPKLASSIGSWRTQAPAFPLTPEGSHRRLPLHPCRESQAVFAICLGAVHAFSIWLGAQPAREVFILQYTYLALRALGGSVRSRELSVLRS